MQVRGLLLLFGFIQKLPLRFNLTVSEERSHDGLKHAGDTFSDQSLYLLQL
jgi:hypothetical protein